MRYSQEKRQESDPSFVKQEEERREDEGEEEKAWRGGNNYKPTSNIVEGDESGKMGRAWSRKEL